MKNTNKIVRRVMENYGLYETRTYRYIYRHGDIVRIRIAYLDTTAALDRNNWEYIATI